MTLKSSTISYFVLLFTLYETLQNYNFRETPA